MASNKILDLDAQIGIDNTPSATKPFKLFGRTWTMMCDLNSFAMSDLTTGEPAAIVRFIDSVILPAERVDFRNAISSQPNLTAEKLGAILTALVEAAAERPTTPPSASSRGATNPTSPRKSAANSSVTRVAR